MRRRRPAELHGGRVDHVARFQIAAGRNRGAAYRDCSDIVALGLDLRAALAANRSGNPAAKLELVVRGVDDRVRIHLRQIALANFDSLAEIHAGSRLWMVMRMRMPGPGAAIAYSRAMPFS